MTLRTPRRRISPRTKLRYRAIREFFRRALGSTSQQESKVNSSTAVNVTDLKRKLVGLEKQLEAVSKHCQISSQDTNSKRDSDCSYQYDVKTDSSDKVLSVESRGDDTQLIYKSSGSNIHKSEEEFIKPQDNNIIPSRHPHGSDGNLTKVKKKNKLHKHYNSNNKLHKHKSRSSYNNDKALVYSTSSFRSLTALQTDHTLGYFNNSDDRRHLKEEYLEDIMNRHHIKNRSNKEHKSKIGDHMKGANENKIINRPNRNKYSRDTDPKLDPKFIADIIQRQYKPVKLFSKNDLSQFSAPVCRDQELSTPEKIEVPYCSCLYNDEVDERKSSRPKRKDLNGIQSVCDARIYSNKKLFKQRQRKMHIDSYSNADMYDLIPVKERSSPKTRRKFVDEHEIPYDMYKEVPPSPTTLRPRLNLKAQLYTDALDDHVAHVQQHVRKHSPERFKQCIEEFDTDVSNMSENIVKQQLSRKDLKVPIDKKPIHISRIPADIRRENITTSSMDYPQFSNEQSRNTSAEKSTSKKELKTDKTDNALSEIKNILQNFLHEIKKESVAPPCDKTDATPRVQENDINEHDNNAKNNTTSNNQNAGQHGISPFLTQFTNPYCYPIMSMCSMNCPLSVPNGYMVPNQNYNCANCVNAPKESSSTHCNIASEPGNSTETDELIKEIYKFVAQASSAKTEGPIEQKQPDSKQDIKVSTARSTGESNYKSFQKDANVGTQSLKCLSQSYENLDSKPTTEPQYTTNETYSDSLLDKLSLEVTSHSISESELQSVICEPEVLPTVKVNKFSKVLRSLGIFKKKKKDVIVEVSESDSVIDEMASTKQLPYGQEITNYMMYGQEYYRPPPHKDLYYQGQPSQCMHQERHHDYRMYPHEYNPRSQEYPPQEYQQDYIPGMRNDDGRRYHSQMREHQRDYSPYSRYPPYNSSYDSNYSQMQPPVCLKEIEVRSTGTQSERKLSIFKKIGQRKPPPKKVSLNNHDYEINCCAQTAQCVNAGRPPNAMANQQANAATVKPAEEKKTMFNWKTLQAKAMKSVQNPDTFMYTLNTRKELAESDNKLRNAMLKKLLSKNKNPLSNNSMLKILLNTNKPKKDVDILDSLKFRNEKMFF